MGPILSASCVDVFVYHSAGSPYAKSFHLGWSSRSGLVHNAPARFTNMFCNATCRRRCAGCFESNPVMAHQGVKMKTIIVIKQQETKNLNSPNYVGSVWICHLCDLGFALEDVEDIRAIGADQVQVGCPCCAQTIILPLEA